MAFKELDVTIHAQAIEMKRQIFERSEKKASYIKITQLSKLWHKRQTDEMKIYNLTIQTYFSFYIVGLFSFQELEGPGRFLQVWPHVRHLPEALRQQPVRRD